MRRTLVTDAGPAPRGHFQHDDIGMTDLVFFYGTRKYDLGTWGAIRAKADPDHRAIWIGEGDIFSYLGVFDGIYPYSIAWSPNPAGQLASSAGTSTHAISRPEAASWSRNQSASWEMFIVPRRRPR